MKNLKNFKPVFLRKSFPFRKKIGSSTFSVDLIYGVYQIHTKQFEGGRP